MKSKNFVFTGGAGGYLLTGIIASLITYCSLGLAYPWALCMRQQWIARNTYIQGRRLRFTAGGFSLISLWLKWWVLMFVTVGIYYFWIAPDMQRWITEHTDFEDS